MFRFQFHRAAVPLTDRNLPTSFWNPYAVNGPTAPNAHSIASREYTSCSQLAASPTTNQPLMQLESLSQLTHLQSPSTSHQATYTPQMADIIQSSVSSSASSSSSSGRKTQNRKYKSSAKNHSNSLQDPSGKSPTSQSIACRSPSKAMLHQLDSLDSNKICLHSPEVAMSNLSPPIHQSMHSNMLQSNAICSSPSSFGRPMMPTLPNASNSVDFYANSAFGPGTTIASGCDWSAPAAAAMNSSASYFNSMFHQSSPSTLESQLAQHNSHLQQQQHSSLNSSNTVNHGPAAHHPPQHHLQHHSPPSLLTNAHHPHSHQLSSATSATSGSSSSASTSSMHATEASASAASHLPHLAQSLSTIVVSTVNATDPLDLNSQTSPLVSTPGNASTISHHPSAASLQSSPQSPLEHSAHAPSHLDLTSSQPLLATHPFHHPQTGYPAQDSSPAAAATSQSFGYQHPPLKRACLERRDSPCLQPPTKLGRLTGASDRFAKDDKSSCHDSTGSASYGSSSSSTSSSSLTTYNGLLLGSSQSSSLEHLDSNNNSLNGLGSSFSPISAYSNYYGLGGSLASDGTASAIAFHAANPLHHHHHHHQPAIGHHSLPPQYAPYNTYGNYHGYGLSSVSGTHLFQHHLARFSALI